MKVRSNGHNHELLLSRKLVITVTGTAFVHNELMNEGNLCEGSVPQMAPEQSFP